MNPKHLKYHLLALATVVAWAVSFINTRVLLDAGVSPIELYVYRFIIAYVFMLAWSRFRVRITPWPLTSVASLTQASSYPLPLKRILL